VFGGAGVVPLVHTYLFRKEVLRPDLGLKYDLATRHELGADRVTWTFHLRPDAKIAPNTLGVPERALDAEDVLASFRRIADRATGATGYSFFNTWVSRFDAPDAATVRLVLKKPYAWAEEALGDALSGAIVPREWLAGSRDALKTNAVGAGPFALKSLAEGREAVMVANPNFYDRTLPRVDQFRIVPFQDQVTYRTAFASGQLDVYFAQNIEEARELEKTVPRTRRMEIQSTGFNSFWMRTDAPPWQDDRVRRAMNLSMNRQQYIELIGKGQGVPAGPVPPVFGAFALPADELARLQPYSPAEARRLFDAAGVSEIAFAHPTSSSMPDYVAMMSQQLSAIGMRVKPQPMDASSWLAAYFGGKLTASFSLNQSYKTPDAALLWYRTGGFTGTGAYDTKWSKPAIDRLIDEAAVTLEPRAREAAYREAARQILAADPPFINVFQIGGNPLVHERVGEYDAGPGAMSNFMMRYVWLRD